MALQDIYTNWWKLGSDAQLTDELASTVLTKTGTVTYQSCKFDNGAYTSSNGLLTKSSYSIDGNAFWNEFWIKTDFNVTNGSPSDSGRHDIFWYNVNSSNYILMSFYYTSGILFFVRSAGVNHLIYLTNPVLTWTSSDLVWLMPVFDRSGIAGSSDTFRLYMAKNSGSVSLADSSTMSVSSFTPTTANFHLLNEPTGTLPVDSVVDNFKNVQGTANITTANLIDAQNNRNTEGFGVVGYPIANKYNFNRGLTCH